MKRECLDGFYLFLLGAVVFLSFGLLLETNSRAAMGDFNQVYYAARCLQQHCDPYNVRSIENFYLHEGGKALSSSSDTTERALFQDVTEVLYLPTALLVVAPLAVLPIGSAHLLWMVTTGTAFVVAAFIAWFAGAEHAPTISGFLACCVLSTSVLFLVLGNPACIAISLCVVACWCFLEERFAWVGVFCLAISLLLKPHNSGLIWLFFLLAGGTQRKRAVQTLVLTIALALVAGFWIALVAPNWIQELHSNLRISSMPGAVNDPGPSVPGRRMGMIVSLQAALSFFRDDPGFYNPMSFLIGAALILAWFFKTLRLRRSPKMAWLGIASIAALTLLPVYHRSYDSRLLLLAIPACAILWSEGSLMGRSAVGLTTAAILLTGDIPWALFYALIGHLEQSQPKLSAQLLIVAQAFTGPTILLALAAFYLWIYLRHESEDSIPQEIAAQEF